MAGAPWPRLWHLRLCFAARSELAAAGARAVSGLLAGQLAHDREAATEALALGMLVPAASAEEHVLGRLREAPRASAAAAWLMLSGAI